MPGRAEHDFVELTEDLSGSPLWNPDLAPTPLARRTWSTYHIVTFGLSFVLYLAVSRRTATRGRGW